MIRGLGARILYETLFIRYISIIAFGFLINDLLALRTSHRTFHSQTGGMIFGMVSADASESYSVKDNGGLHLVNYRSKQPVVWADTVNWESNLIGQVTDSIVYGGDLENGIVLWKIGEKPKK